ncbi:hypothetical protein [Streptomyces sp. CB03911]|uniref:hypothetical protein n=1 Tax=Streptomyces sp. CB03911 TaxID=1804758 RepID=UPI00093E6F3A|nr:hypothetical protein [Streptomyces sp. CB03911]OKI22198.1 hypothetical protein A6A07_34550 [Streptomyces sp. CB03911]
MAGPVTLTWLACDLKSGYVAEELPALGPAQALTRRLGASTSCSFALALPGAPREWESATDQGRTMLVGADPTTGTPVWTGMTLVRDGGSDPALDLTCATPEAYLDRRFPGDYSATATDATTVMAALATPALSGGPPIALDTAPSGLLIDYTVLDSEDKSILSCLTEIAAMAGAPEWTVDCVWADAAQTHVQLVLRIRPTIGTQAASPPAVFDMPGCISRYRLTEQYDKGRGATRVTARGEQTQGVRATSTAHTNSPLIAAGWPLWEHRWTPATGITSTDQLERHASEALALMATGAKAWSLEAVASRAPRLGTDWALGDSVRIQVDRSPRHPNGATAIARAYAWTLDPRADRLAPILLED